MARDRVIVRAKQKKKKNTEIPALNFLLSCLGRRQRGRARGRAARRAAEMTRRPLPYCHARCKTCHYAGIPAPPARTIHKAACAQGKTKRGNKCAAVPSAMATGPPRRAPVLSSRLSSRDRARVPSPDAAALAGGPAGARGPVLCTARAAVGRDSPPAALPLPPCAERSPPSLVVVLTVPHLLTNSSLTAGSSRPRVQMAVAREVWQRERRRRVSAGGGSARAAAEGRRRFPCAQGTLEQTLHPPDRAPRPLLAFRPPPLACSFPLLYETPPVRQQHTVVPASDPSPPLCNMRCARSPPRESGPMQVRVGPAAGPLGPSPTVATAVPTAHARPRESQFNLGLSFRRAPPRLALLTPIRRSAMAHSRVREHAASRREGGMTVVAIAALVCRDGGSAGSTSKPHNECCRFRIPTRNDLRTRRARGPRRRRRRRHRSAHRSRQ